MEPLNVFGVMPFDIRECWQSIASMAPTYLVGGAVRDILRGQMPHDWDFATAMKPEETLRWGARSGYHMVPTGIAFGTITVILESHHVEVTTFREEDRYRDYRHPEKINFVRSIEQDLSRRDLTINAMAIDWLGQLVDPFGGAEDLKKHVIRAVRNPRERFAEDPLRMLRAVRFFGMGPNFSWDQATLEAMVELKELTCQVSPERQRDEMKKIISSSNCALPLHVLDETGLMGVIWPEWIQTRGFDQRSLYHPLPLHEHLLATAYRGSTEVLRLAGLLHDIGKPLCLSIGDDGVGHFYGHDKIGADRAFRMLMRMHWDSRTARYIADLIDWHMYPWDDLSDGSIRRMLREHGWEMVQDLLELRHNDMHAMGCEWTNESAVRRHIDSLWNEVPKEARRLQITGHDIMRILNIPPGPQVGEILRSVQDWVDEDLTHNQPQLLVEYVQQRYKN